MSSQIQITLITLLFILSCTKENPFPNTYVNESIPITMAEYSNVYNNIWGYEYIHGGLGVIIIVQGLNNEFIAYDRSCTNEINSLSNTNVSASRLNTNTGSSNRS